MRARPLLLVAVVVVAALLVVFFANRGADLPGSGGPGGGAGGAAQAADGRTHSADAAAEAAVGDAADAASANRVAAPRDGSPTYTVRGLVLREAGTSLAGAEVLAFRGRSGEEQSLFAVMSLANRSRGSGEEDLPWVTRGNPIARTAVAADGSFALETTERHLRLRLLHDFYGMSVPELVHVDATTKQAWVVLDPYLGGCVQGRLVGTANGDPTVRLLPELDPMSAARDPMEFVGSILAAASGDALPVEDSRFVARAVPAGSPFTVLATAADGAARQRQQSLVPGELREVVVPWVETSTLRVHVVDEQGTAIADVRVQAHEPDRSSTSAAMPAATSRTDAAGACNLANLLPGSYTVTATARDRISATVDATVPTATVLQLVLRRGGSVAGVVVDRDGAPIAGAHVIPVESISVPMLGDLTASMGLDLLALAAESGNETDAQGRFVCHGIDGEASFHVVAAHERYAPGIQKDASSGATDLRIVLLDTASVETSVIDDATGEPIGEFSIALRQRMFMVVERDVRKQAFGPEHSGPARIDSVDAGDYTIAASAEGFAEATGRVKVEAGAVAKVAPLRLRRSARVSGRVVDDTGRPVAGALVQRSRGGIADNPALAMLQGAAARTRTDEKGAFALTSLPPGRIQLLASAEGFASASSARLELAAGEQLDDVEIAMGHGGTIEGRLLVAEGEHAEDFTLHAQNQVSQKSAGAKIAADGAFRITDLEPGTWQVQAMHPAAMRAATASSQNDSRPGRANHVGKLISQLTENTVTGQCTVRLGETAELELDARDLGGGVRLTLDVRIGDQPAEDGIVEATQLDDGAMRAGFLENGRTSFASMKPGSVRVQVRTGLTMAPVGEPVTIDVPKGTDHHRHSVSLPAGELGGRVVDADTGEALPFVLVRLVRDGDAGKAADHGTAITREDGTFSFRGLAPGRYGLVAADALVQRTVDGSASRLDAIDLLVGQRRTDLVLRAQPAAGLAVRVVDDQGSPVAGAMLLAVDDEGRSIGAFAMAVSDAEGRAHLGGLPQGRVRVVGRAPGRAPDASSPVESQPGRSQTVDLVLRRGTRVVLDARDRQGAPLRSYDVRARCNGGPWFPAFLLLEARGEGGTAELGRLAPGEWEFALSHPTAGSFSVRRSVADGPTVTIVAAPGG